MEDTLETLGYDPDDSTEVEFYNELPNNCALGVLNLSVTNGDSRQNQTVESNNDDSVTLAHFCAACKPGYSGTPMNNIYPFVKVKCTKINNCTGE